MPTIRKSLLQFVFAGAFMKRWNDKVRPMELVEVDKQAHKMIAAWALFELNSQDLDPEERLALGREVIEGGLFEYFYRLVITDIKPPIFYKIKDNPEHYRRLTDWVLTQLEPRLQPLGPEFRQRLSRYLREEETSEANARARRILYAAHLYASNWEFNLIKGLNVADDEFQEIETWFKEALNEHTDLIGVSQLLEGTSSPLGRFAHLCGQLRFQKRWSQTPRIPETSVIGHMFLVACYGYFFSMALGACNARAQNNFFTGLFHDLPELLTRDIISPVKKSVSLLADLVKEYEDLELKRRVLGPLEQGGLSPLADRLAYFLGLEVGSEFYSAIRENNTPRKVSLEELQAEYNQDHLDPKDGRMLKVCDALAAFIEAYTALRNGISSDQLQQALWRMRRDYKNVSLGESLHIGALLADFD
ncbi:MAG: HD domain-containing protein [Desulfovibrio sp.]|nr:MAG: HD domain-containing protein [Desulfovibrio sp.]